MERKDARKLIRSLSTAAIAVGALTLIHITLLLLGIQPAYFGLVPRDLLGLTGILTSPFVHADWAHLLSNAGPLFVFIAAALYFYRKAFLRALPWMFFMTGIWVWVAGKSGPHIGASGIAYALAAFLFFGGVFRRNTQNLALSLVIAFFYGSMIWGVLPVQPGVSWESHLFGAVSGLVLAWYFRKLGVPPRKKYFWEEEVDNPHEDKYAAWNYRENWSGAKQIIIPGESNYPPEQW